MNRRPMTAIATEVVRCSRRPRAFLFHQKKDRSRRTGKLHAPVGEAADNRETEGALVERDGLREIVDVDIDEEICHGRATRRRDPLPCDVTIFVTPSGSSESTVSAS